MKKLLLLILLLCVGASVQVSAQNYIDVIRFKNDSIQKGYIIELIPAQTVKLQTRDGQMLEFSMDSVKDITKEIDLTKKSGKKFDMTKVKTKGYRMYLELFSGIPYGKVKPTDTHYPAFQNNAVRYGLSMINGYQSNAHLYTGFGVGAGYFYDLSDEGLEVPAFTDVRINFTSGQFSPVLVWDVGYVFVLKSKTNLSERSGFFTNPGIGFRGYITRSLSGNFYIGYLLQESRDYLELPGTTYSSYQNTIRHYLCMKMGISF
ncbi:MAG: hypothetical protein WCM76_14375 [Bacteroidota bacterium]